MNIDNQFAFDDEQSNFDFKLLLFKLLSHWKWFVVTLVAALAIAYYINLHKQNIYELDSYVTIKEENNPFFTSNMSLVFNWGGVSDKVNLIITTLKSRSHNEKVVDKLKSYISYQKKGRYYWIDLYQKSPFIFKPDASKWQVINVPIEIKVLNDQQIQIYFKPNKNLVTLYQYKDKISKKASVNPITKTINFGEPINLDFISGTFYRNTKAGYDQNTIYRLTLKDFNKVVSNMKDRLVVKNKNKNSSILVLKLRGQNKDEIADYLNTTTGLLKKQILDDKNKFALNTIKFIDSTLKYISKDLSVAARDLKDFISNKTILNLDDPTSKLFEKVSAFDQTKSTVTLKKLYYEQLLDYLNNKKNYENLPAPTVVGIDDPTIIEKVGRITQLAVKRRNELTHFQPDAPVIKRIDLEIESLRQSLLQTVQSALHTLNQEMELIDKKIKKIEAQINKLPEEKQILLGLKRKYDLKQEIYNTLLQKRNEAGIVKASNVSDLKIIDNAKDVGQPPVAPNRQINYLIALAAGLFLPALIIIILFFLDNKVHDISDVENLTDTPIIGQVYHWDKKGNLPVLNYPDDIISESFRSLRSALRFMFPAHKKSHTVLITSSISGEGKTFVSSNLAIVQAISNKKTVVLEFDLRKPKFKEYFKEAQSDHLGLSHYLSGLASLDDIIVPTGVENLDLILSGKVPPNPSELILNDLTAELFEQLSAKYDQIIIDTPPMGLVSDAMELQKHADIAIFIVREDYTLKSLVKDIDERHKKKQMKNLGIIYNDFKVNAFKKYGYGHKYGYGYGYGYGDYFDKKQQSWWQKLWHKFTGH